MVPWSFRLSAVILREQRQYLKPKKPVYIYSKNNFIAINAYDDYDLFYYYKVYEIKEHLL
jgi:hypothetical protein